jgi:uncharacterized protein (DUF2147 family)
MMRPTLTAALALAAVTVSFATARAQDPAEGVWLVQGGDAKVRIGACAGAPAQLCGVIVWMDAPRDEQGQPKHDAHNPDPALRGRPLLGLQMISGFHATGPGQWEGGRIYDPHNGTSYDSKLRVAEDGRLKVSGCVSFLCKTQTWTRSPN